MDTQQINLKNILGKSKEQLLIPYYQRDYVWTVENQVEKLFNDILETINKKEIEKYSHFMGTIFVQNDINRHGETKKIIVDGQQRLTTILILLSALSLLLEKDEKERIRSEYLYFYKDDGEQEIKIKYGEAFQKNQSNIVKIIRNPNTIGEEDSRLFENYKYLLNKLRKMKEENSSDFLKSFLSIVEERLNFIVITLEDTDQTAHEIFENINGTACHLKKYEIITNYIYLTKFKEIDDTNGIEQWQENIFKKYISKIDFNLLSKEMPNPSDEKELFIFYYTKLYEQSTNEKNLYNCFKLIHQNKFKNNIEFLLEDMLAYSLIWKTIRNPKIEADSHIKLFLTNLNGMKISVVYPLIMFILKNYSEYIVQRNEMLNTLENLIVRTKLSSGVNINKKLEKLSIDLINELSKGFKFDHETPHFNGFSDIYLTDEEIKQVFDEEDIDDNIAKVVLRIVEYYEQKNNETKEHTIFDEITLEHIIPKDQANWKLITKEEHEFFKQKIGNLTILTQSSNSKLKNDTFENKKEKIYIKSNFELNKKLSLLADFNIETVKERTGTIYNKFISACPYSLTTLKNKKEEIEKNLPKQFNKKLNFEIRFLQGENVFNGYTRGEFIEKFMKSLFQKAEENKMKELSNGYLISSINSAELEKYIVIDRYSINEEYRKNCYSERLYLLKDSWKRHRSLVIDLIFGLELSSATVKIHYK